MEWVLQAPLPSARVVQCLKKSHSHPQARNKQVVWQLLGSIIVTALLLARRERDISVFTFKYFPLKRIKLLMCLYICLRNHSLFRM